MTSSQPVLIVMDFQQGIVDRIGDQALAAAVRAVDAARASGVPVFFVRVAFRPGFPEIAVSNRSFGPRKASASESASASASASASVDSGMHETSASTQIHSAFDVRADEPVIVKRRVSAFSGSDLDVLLRGYDARRIVLAGLSTSGVVLSTLRQAADLDFDITVLEDACGDNDPQVHRVLTEKVFPRQAFVTTVDEWAASLG